MQAIGHKKQGGTIDPGKITRVLLVVYTLVIAWILLFKLGVQFSYMAERRVNLFPFRDAFFVIILLVLLKLNMLPIRYQ
jgi:membrane protein YdbS with pleckstrin-like domain